MAPTSVNSEAASLWPFHRFIGTISFADDLLRRRYTINSGMNIGLRKFLTDGRGWPRG